MKPGLHLAPKMDLFRAWVADHRPSIITLSEKWLHSNICNDEIHIDNYQLYRADRPSRAGGVATYVASYLVSKRLTPEVDPIHFECLFIKITLHKNKQLIIGNIYRPPLPRLSLPITY